MHNVYFLLSHKHYSMKKKKSIKILQKIFLKFYWKYPFFYPLLDPKRAFSKIFTSVASFSVQTTKTIIVIKFAQNMFLYLVKWLIILMSN